MKNLKITDKTLKSLYSDLRRKVKKVEELTERLAIFREDITDTLVRINDRCKEISRQRI